MLTEPIPAGASVLAGSVHGSFERYEIQAGNLVFFIGTALGGLALLRSLWHGLRLLLGDLGPYLALSRGLLCRHCLSCHFSSRLPVAPPLGVAPRLIG